MIFKVIHQATMKTQNLDKTSIHRKPLSLDILKKFIFSIEGKDQFRNIMRKIKQQRIINRNEFDDKRKYIPLTFEAMLNYLYEQSIRKSIEKSINFDQKSH